MLVVIVFVLGVGMLLLIENDLCGCGLLLDGEVVCDGGGWYVGVFLVVVNVLVGVMVCEVVMLWLFVSFYVVCFVCLFGVFVLFVYFVLYVFDYGVVLLMVVLLFGVIGVGSMVGCFFFGGFVDCFGCCVLLFVMFVGMVVVLVVWVGVGIVVMFVVFVFVFGVFYGGWVVVLLVVVMDYFGGCNVSVIIGILYMSVVFGMLVGLVVVGFVYDVGGGYFVLIFVSVVVNVIVFVIVVIIGCVLVVVCVVGG